MVGYRFMSRPYGKWLTDAAVSCVVYMCVPGYIGFGCSIQFNFTGSAADPDYRYVCYLLLQRDVPFSLTADNRLW